MTAGLAPMLGLAAPLLLAAADEKGFFRLPGEEDVRFQSVSRTDGERDWPFAAADGYLACVTVLGQRQVYFVEKAAVEDRKNAVLAISSDPFQLAFANIGKTRLFAPNGGLEDLLRRVAPFVQAGQRLCDQPRGSAIGAGEL